MNDKEIIAKLEVALYSSGRPLSIDDLMRASGIESRKKILQLLDNIIRKMRSVFYAIEIKILPDKSYVFQVKSKYNTIVRKYASRPMLQKAVLKTLSCIAYMQPVTSKQLLEVRGTVIYQHIKELKQFGYIMYQSVGRIRTYTTTEKFQKYFGINGDIKYLKQKLFDITNNKNYINENEK